MTIMLVDCRGHDGRWLFGGVSLFNDDAEVGKAAFIPLHYFFGCLPLSLMPIQIVERDLKNWRNAKRVHTTIHQR